MKSFLATYFAALLCFLLLDGPWLYFMGSAFYTPRLGHLLASEPQFAAAGLFYLVYALGITVLVIQPSRRAVSPVRQAFMAGALFGFVAYATYDLTNQATLKDWPVIVTVVDLVWGTVLTATASAAALWITRRNP